MATNTDQPIVSPIVIGKVGRTYGVQGWLKVNSYTSPADNILDYDQWLFQYKGQWQTIPDVELQQHGQGIIIHFTGVDNPEEAQQYVNMPIAITHDQLGKLPEGEYYWCDLEGLTVINENGIELGTVERLMETGANDVLVVKGEEKILVPVVKGQVLKDVNLAEGRILVDWSGEFL